MTSQRLPVAAQYEMRDIQPGIKVFEHARSSDDFSIFKIFCVARFHFGQGFRKQLYNSTQTQNLAQVQNRNLYPRIHSFQQFKGPYNLHQNLEPILAYHLIVSHCKWYLDKLNHTRQNWTTVQGCSVYKCEVKLSRLIDINNAVYIRQLSHCTDTGKHL